MLFSVRLFFCLQGLIGGSAAWPVVTGKRLERSVERRVVSGVFGGLGEYLGVDPNILRVAGVILLIFAAAPMVLLYLVAVLLIPRAGQAQAPVASIDLARWAPVAVGLVLFIIGAVMFGPAVASAAYLFFFPIQAILAAVGAVVGLVLMIVGVALMVSRLREL